MEFYPQKPPGAGRTRLACVASHACAGMAPRPTEADLNTYWIESAVGTVLVNTPIPANCTSNMMVPAEVPGGVRSLLQCSFRVTTVSHQVTPLRGDAEGRIESLISAMFSLERVPVKLLPPAK